IETVYTHIRGELDEPTLTAIANATGGAFFRATDPRALARVLQRIDALEKTRLTSPKREQIDELYFAPLAAGLALLALSLLGGETYWMKVAG
ncbi:MAG: aerotolerance regulator BatA, partial [Acidobacteriota bacterium]|nr:aerotolerance regulator BatA [Acidobacteriota bacterium]